MHSPVKATCAFRSTEVSYRAAFSLRLWRPGDRPVDSVTFGDGYFVHAKKQTVCVPPVRETTVTSRPASPAGGSAAKYPFRPELSSPGGRTVTHKVLSLLTTFEDPRRSFTLTQLADSAEIPLSTAHRLTNELVDWGFLTRTAQGRYQLGLRLWEMGQNVGHQLRETARPFIQDLYSLTGETSQLAIRDGREVLYIDRVYGTERVPRASRVGGRLPMHSTAVGKVLLAYEESWVREAYLQRPMDQVAPRTVINPGVLARQLDAVAEEGHATTVEEQRLGACSIAVPVFHSGRIGAALGLVVSSEKASTFTRHLPALRGISKRLEQATSHIPLETLLESHLDSHSRR